MPSPTIPDNSSIKIVKAISYAGITITILAWLGAAMGYIFSLTLSDELPTKISIMSPRSAVQLLSIAYGWITCGIGFLLCGIGLFIQSKVKGLKTAFIFASLYFLPVTFFILFSDRF